jgi:hypothetical protein
MNTLTHLSNVWPRSAALSVAGAVLAAMLAACGGSGSAGNDAATATPAPPAAGTPPSAGTPPTAGTPPSSGTPPVAPPPAGDKAFETAMKLWRDDDLTRHPKGSCAGCHGADFFDLARIGSTDADIQRRAVIDGATPEEAQALVQAINDMRTRFKLVATNARTFRPFQPGEAVLLPNLSDASHVQAVKRDIAFGQQLQALLPTLFGERIDSLQKAQRARDEWMDLINGSNAAGANPRRLDLRTLQTGVQYPLWSADLHHGKAEGTFNDWIADIAHDPKPEYKTQWLALQDAYLANPSTENFWKMAHAAPTMTRPPLLGTCTLTTADDVNAPLACGAAPNFNRHKFMAALTGQHMLRQQALGMDDFLRGPLGFSYLDSDATFAFMRNRKDPEFLPADLWEIGDRGRVMLDDSQRTGSFREGLAKLGFPQFAQDSIDADRTEAEEQHRLRLAWFWIGFTHDPSFARIHASNATKVGEYMVATLIDERMFLHNAFQAHTRLLAKGHLPQANVRAIGSRNLEFLPPAFLINYSYFTAYGRTVLNWNESNKEGILFDAALKNQQAELWGRMVGNGFRMSMHLQLDALGKPPLAGNADQRTQIKGWLEDGVNPNGSVRRGGFYAMHRMFSTYQPQHDAADDELMSQLAQALGATLPPY